jgi:uncharacterized delta-60 repeat protein
MRAARLTLAICVAGALCSLATATAIGAFSHGRETLQFGPHSSVESALPLPGSRILLLGTVAEDEGLGLVELQPDGSVDTTFGHDGVLEINYNDVAVDRQGRILLASSRKLADSSFDATVTRLLPSGLVDSSFGIDGVATLDFGRRLDFGSAVGVQPDGRILVGGFSANAESRGRSDGAPVVARLLADGRQDPSFAKGRHKVMTSYGPPLVEESGVVDFAMGPHRRILVGLGEEGQIGIARLRPNGAIDPSFGNRGAIVVGGFDPIPGWEWFDPITKLAVLPDGRIVAAGTVLGDGLDQFPYSLMVVRYRADGRPDRSFGHAGHAIARYRGDTFASAFALQRSGRVIVAATTHAKPRGAHLSLTSFRQSGRLNRRFGHRGRLRIGFPGPTWAEALVLQRPGRAVAIGLLEDSKPPYEPNRTVLARVPLAGPPFR